MLCMTSRQHAIMRAVTCVRLHVYGLVQSVLLVTLCAMFCALHHVSLPFWARVDFICGMLRCSRATLRNERVVTCEEWASSDVWDTKCRAQSTVNCDVPVDARVWWLRGFIMWSQWFKNWLIKTSVKTQESNVFAVLFHPCYISLMSCTCLIMAEHLPSLLLVASINDF